MDDNDIHAAINAAQGMPGGMATVTTAINDLAAAIRGAAPGPDIVYAANSLDEAIAAIRKAAAAAAAIVAVSDLKYEEGRADERVALLASLLDKSLVVLPPARPALRLVSGG
jgi:hypothetical protein